MTRSGSWRLRIFFLASFMKVPTAWQMASILYTAPDPGEFWCAANHSVHPCSIPCEGYNFSSNALTFVTQWNLVCDRQYLAPLSQVCYLCGVLLGGILCTLLLKWFSPKAILVGGMICQVAAGGGEAFVTGYVVQCILRTITATACTCSFTTGYIICTDMKKGRARTMVAACYEHMWSVGVITLAGFGYLLDTNWTYLQLAYSLPTVLIIFLYPWIPDSPTWLIAKGKLEEARRNMEEAAAFNIEPPDNATKANSEVTWCEVLHRPNCFALHIVWITTVVTYYGALLNLKSYGPHVYVNTVIIGIAEIVGVQIGLALIVWLNDKKWMALGVVMLIGGSASIASLALPMEGMWSTEWQMLTLGALGKIAVAVSLTVIQLSSGELLPQSGLFSCVTTARVFLLGAPFIGFLAIYGSRVSLSMFGGITVVGGFAAFLIRNPAQKSRPKIKLQVATWDKDTTQTCFSN